MARARALAGECRGLTEGDLIFQSGIVASGEFSYPLNCTGLQRPPSPASISNTYSFDSFGRDGITS